MWSTNFIWLANLLLHFLHQYLRSWMVIHQHLYICRWYEEKDAKLFFLPQTKIEANKILKPYPCFLSHSNFSTFFRVTTSMSSTTWNIFTKRLFSRLWFHFQSLHFSTTLPFLFSFPWIEHTQRKCNWHHMSLEEKLSIFDPWGKNNDNFRWSQLRSARKNLLRIGTWSCWLVAVLLMLV